MADPKGRVRNNNAFGDLPPDFLSGVMTGDVDASVPNNALLTVDQDNNLHVGRFTLSSTGVSLPDDTQEDEYANLGHVLLQLQTSTQWLIGDWLNFGIDRQWGETYKAVAEHFGYEVETLWTYASVCRSVESLTRIKDLSFSHHRAVAKLSTEDQRIWLEHARGNGWSSKQLGAELSRALREPVKKPSRWEVWQHKLDGLLAQAKSKEQRKRLAELLRQKADELDQD